MLGKFEKILEKILSGRSDVNINFSDICAFLEKLGFSSRTKGSHHIFFNENVEEILNLQPKKDGKAKPYQVKQVRNLILKYKMGIDNE